MEAAKDWIEQWLLLWPAEVKSGGESIRTKAKYCVNKLQKWIDAHQNITKDTIFAATKLYLKEFEQNKWFGVRRATYFIDKLGVGSGLEDYCERLTAPPPVVNINEIPEYDPSSEFI